MRGKLSRVCVALVLAMLTLGQQAIAQTSIRGKVLDSSSKPVGGVDVAIYVPGQKDAVQSVKSAPGTGAYAFSKVAVGGAFDIAYTHSMYAPVFVTRLAQNNPQEITKVIYLKGEPMPAGALQERFQSARRFSFLANSINGDADRSDFVLRFEASIWANLNFPLEKLTTDKPNKATIAFLEQDRENARALLPHDGAAR